MKYIITESQEIVWKVLRRIDNDWKLIKEIVREGLDLDEPCDFKSSEAYIRRILGDSSKTYIYNYTDVSYDGVYRNTISKEAFNTLVRHISKLIEEEMGKEIIEYYNDKKEDLK